MKYVSNLPARARGITIATVLVVVAFTMAFLAIFAIQYYRDIEDRLHRAERVAQAVESHLRLSFERVDAILLQADTDLAGRDLDDVGPAELQTIRSRVLATAPAGFDLQFWRRDGTSPLSGTGTGIVTIRDREHFRAIFDPAFPAEQRRQMLIPTSGNLIGPPVFGRLRSEWIIPVARPLAGADGMPRGSLGVTLPLAPLLAEFASLMEGPEDALFLFRLDHTLMSRWPQNDLLGRKFDNSPVWPLFAQAPRGRFAGAAPSDGKKRIGVFAALSPLPLVLGHSLEVSRLDFSFVTRDLPLLLIVIAMLAALLLYGFYASGLTGRLTRQSEQLHEAQRIGRIGIWESDEATQKAHWSPMMYEITGIPAGTPITAGSVFGAAKMVDPEAYLAARRESVENRRKMEFEVRAEASDGSPRWYHTIADPQYNRAGKFVGMLGVTQDITEQKLLELARQQANTALQATLDATVDGIVTIDGKGCIVTVNRACARMFGYAVEEMLGQDVKMLMPEPYHGEHDGYMEAYHRTHMPKIIGIGREVRGRRSNGEEFDLDLAVAELPPMAGGGAFIGTLRDISQRKQVEEQLRAAQRMEAVGQLTGGIAHDFNNLLAVILGNLELMKFRPGLPETFVPNVDTALRAASRGGELTRQLLSFGRRQALLARNCDLNAVVADVLKLLRRTLPESIDIDFTPLPVAVTASLDVGQLENALMNLSLNARDAMKHGGRLRFAVSHVNLAAIDRTGPEPIPPGGYAAIEVADTGAGMPAETLRRIFEPFFTTKPMGEGTGLGLSMVYGFVRQSGGHIQVRSAPGEGTQFRLLFPAVDVAIIAESGLDGGPVDSPPVSRRRVLVVDDMPDVNAVVSAMLKALGYDVVGAVDSVAALAMLERDPSIEAMLTDIGLPGGMSGLDLAEVAAAKYPDLRIVTMSGYNDEQAREGVASPGVGVHLRKPLRRADLAAAIQQVFAAAG